MTGNSETKISWYPSDQTIERPDDTAASWQRLSELTLLGWPTLAEQTERTILVEWLNPAGDGRMNDGHVLEAAAHTMNTSIRSDLSFLEPAFTAAGEVWGNLHKLARGEAIVDLRSPLLATEDHYPTVEEDEAWREKRQAMGRDWFANVMRWLDTLVSANILFSFELPDLVTRDIRSSLRYEFMREAFDGPCAIGASIFLEPIEGMPGAYMGNGEGIYVADTLASGIQNAIKALEGAIAVEATDPAIQEHDIRRIRAQLGWLWMALKGFIYAGAVSHSGSLLSNMYLRDENLWAFARKSLLDGRDAYEASKSYDTKPVRWIGHGTRLSEEVADIVTEDLIAKMNERIAEARAFRESLRNSR
jgi:hypothetical protein